MLAGFPLGLELGVGDCGVTPLLTSLLGPLLPGARLPVKVMCECQIDIFLIISISKRIYETICVQEHDDTTLDTLFSTPI